MVLCKRKGFSEGNSPVRNALRELAVLSIYIEDAAIEVWLYLGLVLVVFLLLYIGSTYSIFTSWLFKARDSRNELAVRKEG